MHGPLATLRVLPRLTVLLLAAGAGAACGGDQPGRARFHAREAVLRREIQGLKEVIAETEQGKPLLPEGHLVVAVHERLVGDLLRAGLPQETDVDRYHVRVARAEVSFRGKYSLVTLDGSVHVRERPSLSGAIRVFGGLDRLELDLATGTLRARVGIDYVDVERAAGLEDLLGGRMLEQVGEKGRETLRGLLPPIEIPVRLEQELSFGEVSQGPVAIQGARLPLRVTVSQVLALGGRLWVSLDARPGAFQKTPWKRRP